MCANRFWCFACSSAVAIGRAADYRIEVEHTNRTKKSENFHVAFIIDSDLLVLCGRQTDHRLLISWCGQKSQELDSNITWFSYLFYSRIFSLLLLCFFISYLLCAA